jgi:hypothetical protein
MNPEATRTPHTSAPDTQTLIGLLDSLMPLLRQLQLRSEPYAGQRGFGPTEAATSFGTAAPPGPLLDQQAAAEMIEDMNASTLRTLSAYLESHASHTALANCIAIVTQAARCFAVRDHAQTVAFIWQAYRAIASARIQDQELPPPRVAGQDWPRSSSASTLH